MKISNMFIVSCFVFLLCNANITSANTCLQGNCYNGHGTYKWTSGNQYTGTFKDGKREGEGVFIFTNGDKYIGEYKAGKRSGIGVYIFHDDTKYEGEYVDDDPRFTEEIISQWEQFCNALMGRKDKSSPVPEVLAKDASTLLDWYDRGLLDKEQKTWNLTTK